MAENFTQKAPHIINNEALKFIVGDVRNFDFPFGNFSYIIHAAMEASAKLNTENPDLMIVSRQLEDLAPFLSQKELQENILIDLLPEDI